MKERPILFNGEMIRAVLDGRKTVTRRAMKPQPTYVQAEYLPGQAGKHYTKKVCASTYTWPEGNPTHRFLTEIAEDCPYGVPGDTLHAHHEADLVGDTEPLDIILLEVVSVRVERVQKISEEEAKAEGVEPVAEAAEHGHVTAFNSLWWELYPNTEDAHNWDANPWVWVVEFRVVQR